MMRVLITGASGFIGAALARRLTERGCEVFGIGSRPGGALAGDLAAYEVLRLPAPELPERVREWRPEIVFHGAGSADPMGSIADPKRDFDAGPPVVADVLEAVRRSGIESHFVFLSSAAVYGEPESLPVEEGATPNPASPYGCHKWMGELLCRQYAERYGIRATAARIFSAYGPGLRRQVVWDAIGKLAAGEGPAFRGTGEETRDFLFIDDLVEALVRIGGSADPGFRVCNVASGTGTSIAELVAAVARALGRDPGTWRFEGEVPAGAPRHWRADVARLAAMGFAPRVSLEEGVARTVEWWRKEEKGSGAPAGEK